MPRNGNGSYSLPKPPFVPGTTISSADVNSDFSDIATALTGSVAADGQTPITGPLSFPSGSSAAPSITFTADTTTGVYLHGVGELGFASDGGLAAYFDSAQVLHLLGDLQGITGTLTGLLTLSSTSHMLVPNGTTAQRPSATAAAVRYNSTLASLEFSNGTGWVQVASPLSAPQGRLTPTSGVPIISSDVTAAASFFYTPYRGNLCPIYDGTAFTLYPFSELTMTLATQHTAGGIYDVFGFLDAGSMIVGTGPVWTTLTVGSGARGVGAGTTELQQVKGIWTNAVSITARNGATTYTVAANQGTYLGTMYMNTGSNGQVTCQVSYGQSRKFGIWNAYNQEDIQLRAGDATASWGYNTATVRASNGSANNSSTILIGLPTRIYNACNQYINTSSASLSVVAGQIGIGWNVTNAFSGYAGRGGVYVSAGTTVQGDFNVRGEYSLVAPIGLHTATMCEKNTNGNATSNFNGTEASMLMTNQWLG